MPVPEIIDPVFVKTSPIRSLQWLNTSVLGLFSRKRGSINSGTELAAGWNCLGRMGVWKCFIFFSCFFGTRAENNSFSPAFIFEFGIETVGRAEAPNTDFLYYEIGSSFFTSKTSSLANAYGRQWLQTFLNYEHFIILWVHKHHTTPNPHFGEDDVTWRFKGTQDWEFFWLRFLNLYYFFISYVKILRFYQKIFLIRPFLGEIRFFRLVWD